MAIKAGFLARIGGWLLTARRPRRIAPADLAKADFKTSTQRLGVRFTDRIRDTFRFKWLRTRKG
jgi:hypothetical protein